VGDRPEPEARAVEGGHLGAAVADATVVATIGGHRVTAGEVTTLAREAGLPPREALDRLIGEALLAKEAERRGYGGRPEVAVGVRRAAVRALLAAQVERAVPESSITEDELAAAYEAQRARFARPEERTAIHVLFPLAADASEARAAAAQRLAEGVVSELRADGPDAVLARYAANPLAASDAFRVVAETVPGLTRGGAFDPAFLEAVFALQAPGVVPGPVRTRFGWHAIALTSVRPDATLPLDRARVVLRQELLAARRGALLASLVEGLASQTPPLVEGQLAARLASVPVDDPAPAPSEAP
jgi:hypothetical protein